MAYETNNLILSGTVNKGATLRVSPDGAMKVSRFSLSIQQGYGEKVTQASVICKCFNNLAERAEKYLKEGVSILVFGRMETTDWKDNDGNSKSVFELVVNDFQPSVRGVNINRFEVAGRATKEGKYFASTENKRSSVFTTCAYNRTVSKDKKHTEFVDIKAFDKKANFINQYIKKGTPFFARGVLEIGSYTKDSGETKNTYSLLANEVGFTADKGSSATQTSSAPAATPLAATGTDDGFADIPSGFDIPFGMQHITGCVTFKQFTTKGSRTQVDGR